MNDQVSTAKLEMAAPITVEVDIFHVDDLPTGQRGNTASGSYLFVFSQDVVHVDAPHVKTPVVYTLTDDAVQRGFSFKQAYTSDYKYQLTGPILSCSKPKSSSNPHSRKDTISFLHSNTHISLISISLQAVDHHRPHNLVAYDPQITNQPGDV